MALMDAWWEPLLRGIYEPVLGRDAHRARARALLPFDDPPGPGGSAYFGGWYGYVEKDLRTLLGRHGARALLAPLLRPRIAAQGPRLAPAPAGVAAALPRDPRPHAQGSRGRRPSRATALRSSRCACRPPAPEVTPPRCDQITFTATGAISTPPIPWQDRGTFQQAVEVKGDRPR